MSEDRAAALYRALLRAYPARFRERYGKEMLRLFRARRRDAARAGWLPGPGVRFWLQTAWDVAVNGIAERLGEGRRRRWERKTRTAVAHAGDEPPGGGMDSLLDDLRHGLRTLVRNPGFTAVAVVTVALGIGANTAIFSVVEGVLLRPLPYDDPGELAMIWTEMRTRDVRHFMFSPPDFRDVREQATRFDAVAGVFTFSQPLGGEVDPEQVQTAVVTEGFFDILGVEADRGRTFLPEEHEIGDPGGQNLPVAVVLSHALWERRYGEATDVVGGEVVLGGTPIPVVGILPEGFELLLPPEARMDTEADVWIAGRFDFEGAPRQNVFIRTVGRLRDGATLAGAQAELDAVARRIREISSAWDDAGFAIRAEPLHADVTRSVRPLLLALLGAVGFLLLIACANVSNLLLVRASTREREMAVRSALGGSRGQLVRQLLVEAGLIAAAGGVVGVGVAAAGIDLLLFLRPEELPRLESVGIDASVLAFTAGLTAAAALAFGLVPALQASRLDLRSALTERGGNATSRGRRLLRNGVVVVEVALSLVLLVGAGLMVRSFVELQRVDPGFEAEDVLTMGVSLPFPRFPEAGDRARFFTRAREEIVSVPGVEAAGAVFPLPLSGRAFNGRYGDLDAADDPGAFRQAEYKAVIPGYFEAMGSRLLAGRPFRSSDQTDSLAVVVIDEILARKLWPGESPVGERFLVRVSSPEAQEVEVAGVVEHQRSAGLAREGRETVYFTHRFAGAPGLMFWTIRSGIPASGLVEPIRRELEALDPGVPVADVRPMTDYVRDARASTRFALVVIGIFAGIALVLAVVGLYGVLAYTVRQDGPEIGIRMAFGASRERILRLVVGRGLGLTIAGVVIGLAASVGLTRVMEGLLVGVTPTDPLTFGAIALLFVVVAAGAVYLPARRATRVDPLGTLRET